MEEDVKKSSLFKNLDRSDFISLMALIISLGAFGVSLYEANILKSQQAIMQEQQRASVWPYLECDANFVYDNETVMMTMTLVNKGVGPARIERMNWSLEDQKIDSYAKFVKKSKSLLPVDLNFELEYGTPEGILSPGDQQKVFSIQGPRFKDDQSVFREFDLQYQLCYCSIYGDCWTIKEEDKKPMEGCVE